MNTNPTRPIPQQSVYVDTKPFWEGAKAGKLVLQYCEDSGRFQHYPRPVSIYTGGRNLSWKEVSGYGEIYACTVVRVPGPGLEGRLPLAVVIVELEEKVRILGNVLDKDPMAVRIGQKVQVAWDRLGADLKYPAFRVIQD